MGKEDVYSLETDPALGSPQISKEYGKPREYDPKFKGPVHNRSCTDVICCILFLMCILGAAVCSIFGYARGDPRRLIYPTDSAGRFCGQEEFKNKSFLLFFDLLECVRMGPKVVLGCPTPQVCVSECPSQNYVYLQSMEMELLGNRTGARSKLICKNGFDPVASTETIENLVKSGHCAAYYVISRPVINRCIPSVFDQLQDFKDQLVSYDKNAKLETADGEAVTGAKLENGTERLAEFFKLKGYAELVFSDLAESWPWILAGLAIAMVISFLWIMLMRWLVGFMVWLTMALFAGLFAFSSYYSYSRYYRLKVLNVTQEFGLAESFALNLDQFLSLKQTWLAFGCTSSTILAIFLLIIIVLAQRICIAIELIKEGSRAIGKMSLVLLWPIFPFFLQIGVVAFFLSSVIYIGSMGEVEYLSQNVTRGPKQNVVNEILGRVPCNPNTTTIGELCTFVKYGGTTYTVPMQIFMLFMFFWAMNFVVALGQMTLAGAFASYYWAWDKDKDMPTFPLWSSFYRSLRYHTGSLAFGSLIIALIQMIRALLEYIDRKLKGSENEMAKFILKCLKCCFWCIEKILKFINKNAYIMIAIYGRNFCTAARDGFTLIMRNVARTFVLDKVSDFIMLVSQLMVTGGVAVGAYYWFDRELDLHYHLVPVMVLVFGTYLMVSCFFNVYDIAVDTLFLCFCKLGLLRLFIVD